MTARQTTCALIVAAVLALLVWGWMSAWSREQWFHLQKRQLAVIEQFGQFPPPGWAPAAWRQALITPYNVWGNVLYTRSYSGISHAEMRALLAQLEQLLAGTTPHNSADQVDRVMQLLWQVAKRKEFVSAFREEFREQVELVQRRHAEEAER